MVPNSLNRVGEKSFKDVECAHFYIKCVTFISIIDTSIKASNATIVGEFRAFVSRIVDSKGSSYDDLKMKKKKTTKSEVLTCQKRVESLVLRVKHRKEIVKR